MIDARFVPLTQWPGKQRPSYARKRSTFRAKYAARLGMLEKELNHLGAKDIVIQVYLDRNDIRNDGWPRSSARPNQPGVVLSFRKKTGEELSFPCDTYDGWEDNLYAIALSLEALRSVDRYGVTQQAEQYKGWAKLPAPAQEQSKDKEWAYGHLARLAGTVTSALRGNTAAIQLAYRTATRATHPDTGGSTSAFQLLQDAMRVLEVSA